MTFESSCILSFVPLTILFKVIFKYFPTLYPFVLVSISSFACASFTSNTMSTFLPSATSLNSFAVIFLFSIRRSITSSLLISTSPVVLTVNDPVPILSFSYFFILGNGLFLKIFLVWLSFKITKFVY